MAERINLETSLVAPELRDKLFRVDTYGLNCHTFPANERAFDYVTDLTEAVISVGVLTPVLVDSKNIVIAGHGLVDAATRIGLEDIPALRIRDLSVDELEIYAISMARYFSIAGLEHEIYLIEARQMHIILALTQAANDERSDVSEMIPA